MKVFFSQFDESMCARGRESEFTDDGWKNVMNDPVRTAAQYNYFVNRIMISPENK